jgi:hypothetical protein
MDDLVYTNDDAQEVPSLREESVNPQSLLRVPLPPIPTNVPGISFPIKLVSFGYVLVSQVLNNPDNWRVHTKLQKESLLGLMESVGVVDPVLINLRLSPMFPVDLRGGEILVDGHLRIEMADFREMLLYPALFCDLTPLEEKIILTTFNPISEMAKADREKWTQVVSGINSDNAGVQGLYAKLGKKLKAPGERMTEAFKKQQNEGGEPPDDGSVACPKCGYRFSR